jgi:DNA-binding XRE family transcriptional regulator
MTANEVKQIRDFLGLSQEALAEKIGVHSRTIQNWESGGKIPKSKDAILRSLLATPHVVFGGQHVQNGDAINGDKIIERTIEKETIEATAPGQYPDNDVARLIGLLEAKQKSLDNLIAQQSRYLTIIENLSKPQQ